VNGTNSAARANCSIEFGTPSKTINTFVHNLQYLLLTNANHFGDNTKTHWSAFHAIARKAAQLGAQLTTYYSSASAPPGVTTPNPLINQCARTALGIEGYSLHYLTDRTAAGHAWDPEPRYDTRFPLTMHVMRSCFHGQALGNRLGQGIIFSCVDGVTDSASTGVHVLAGLGDVGRNFGGDFAGMGLWKSDEAYDPSVTAQTHAAQDPAEASFTEVLADLGGTQATDPTWTDTFISDHDFCRVALAECCRSSTVKGVLSKAGLGTCNYCLPDVTDASIKSSCPVDQVVSGGVSGVDWVPLQSTGAVYNSVYYAHLNFGSGGGTGISLARSLGKAGTIPVSTLHPDANWDNTNDVVTLSGCAQFDITAATLPPAPLDGMFVNASITYTGNPVLPLTAHWVPNTDASKGAVCTPTTGIPTLCQSQSYPVPDVTPATGGATTMVSIPTWACLGATTMNPTGVGPGYLYLTDANGSWTPPFAASFTCGTDDAGACSTVAPTPAPDAGGAILSCPGSMQLQTCAQPDGAAIGMCGGAGADCCNGGVCPNVNGKCVSCGGSFMCVTANCPSSCSGADASMDADGSSDADASFDADATGN